MFRHRKIRVSADSLYAAWTGWLTGSAAPPRMGSEPRSDSQGMGLMSLG